jgi:hypothetical protein
MRKLLAAVTAALAVSGGVGAAFGPAVAAADDGSTGGSSGDGTAEPGTGRLKGYGLGGAHVAGIPYDEYIRRTGAEWFPDLERQKVDYPAGQIQGHFLEQLLPGIGRWDQENFRLGLDGPSIGYSVDEGEKNVIAAVREGGPGKVLGLSEGALVVEAVQARLATDPNAPSPDTLSFATYGDPVARHAFGEGFLTMNFPVGSVVPAMEYRIPAPVESQYHTDVFVSPYDSIADWPDRQDNWLAMANAIAGLATGHTAVAFTNPSNVPERNIRTVVNSRGGTTTTYMIPQQHLPLVMPLKYIGVDEGTLNQLDAVLQPYVDAGYSRNDNPATAPITVDPVNGYDPAAVTAPATQATFGGDVGTDPISQMLALLNSGFAGPN